MMMAIRNWVVPVIMILCGRTLISSRGGTGVSGNGVGNYLRKHEASHEVRYCAHVPPRCDAFTWGTCTRCDSGGLCIN